MKHKICTLALSGCMAIAMSAFAQDGSMQQSNGSMQQGSMQGGHHGGGMMNPDQQLAHMTKRYNLTSDQQSQLKPILQDHQQEMMQLRSDSSMSKQDKMAKMQSMRQDHMSKVESVLTADQKTKFEADQAKMEQRHMDRKNGGAMGAQDGSTAPPQ